MGMILKYNIDSFVRTSHVHVHEFSCHQQWPQLAGCTHQNMYGTVSNAFPVCWIGSVVYTGPKCTQTWLTQNSSEINTQNTKPKHTSITDQCLILLLSLQRQWATHTMKVSRLIDIRIHYQWPCILTIFCSECIEAYSPHMSTKLTMQCRHAHVHVDEIKAGVCTKSQWEAHPNGQAP